MNNIREVRYNEPGVIVLGTETLSVTELKRRAGLEHLRDVQRIQFFLLLLFTEGKGQHMVDFVSHPVRPNTLILVKPGQVQQFHLNPSLAGQLIVIDPSFLPPEQDAHGGEAARLWWPACTELPDDLARRYLSIASDIHTDSLRYAKYPARRILLQHQLSALLLLLRLSSDGNPTTIASGRAYSVVTRFKQLMEKEYSARRAVSFYAERLGYTEKTLTRACLAVEGRTVKAVLNDRVLLEAKCLLAHRRDSVADIAAALGFTETTNFIRFFKKHEHLTPARFRERHSHPR